MAWDLPSQAILADGQGSGAFSRRVMSAECRARQATADQPGGPSCRPVGAPARSAVRQRADGIPGRLADAGGPAPWHGGWLACWEAGLIILLALASLGSIGLALVGLRGAA